MHDHNLDDLIIHDIPPIKSNKSKNFLTILALLIVVFIVAILLITTLFSTPDANDIVIDESASYRSSDLKLQTSKETKQNTNKKAIEKKHVVNKPEVVKEDTISPKPQASTTPKKTTLPLVKPILKEPAKAKKPEKEKEKEKEVVKNPTAEKPAKVLNPAKTYFVQVGSFTKNPSERFLSVIRNSGFKYIVKDNKTNGTKKLLIGPYETRSAVDIELVKVRDRISKSAFVVEE
jgi:DedD protein